MVMVSKDSRTESLTQYGLGGGGGDLSGGPYKSMDHG